MHGLQLLLFRQTCFRGFGDKYPGRLKATWSSPRSRKAQAPSTCFGCLLGFAPFLSAHINVKLYCTNDHALWCVIPYYTILYYVILYHTMPYYTILYYTILYYTILNETILYETILYNNTVNPRKLEHGFRMMSARNFLLRGI